MLAEEPEPVRYLSMVRNGYPVHSSSLGVASNRTSHCKSPLPILSTYFMSPSIEFQCIKQVVHMYLRLFGLEEFKRNHPCKGMITNDQPSACRDDPCKS